MISSDPLQRVDKRFIIVVIPRLFLESEVGVWVLPGVFAFVDKVVFTLLPPL